MQNEFENAIWEAIHETDLVHWVETTCRYHRVKGTQGLEDIMEIIADTFNGFRGIKARIHHYPSGRKIRYGTFRSPEGWDLNGAEVDLISAGGRVIPLVRDQDMDFGIFSYSGAVRGTKIFDLIRPESIPEAEKYPELLAREVIFTENASIHDLRRYVHVNNVKGIIDSVKGNQEKSGSTPADARAWKGIPLTGDERYEKPDNMPFGISLTSQEGQMINEVFRESSWYGRPPQLAARIDSAFRERTMPVLQIDCFGNQPVSDYVVLTAHICHPRPSAHDNASGVSAALAVARSAAAMLDRVPRHQPRRGLIVLLVPEMLGTIAWLLSHADISGNIIAGANLDMIAGDPEKTGSVVRMISPPSSIHSIVPYIGKYYLDRLSQADCCAWSARPSGVESVPVEPFYVGSDDHILGFPDFRIPVVSLASWPDRYYHTNRDVAGNLDFLRLRQITWAMASSLMDISLMNTAAASSVLKQAVASVNDAAVNQLQNDRILRRMVRNVKTLPAYYPDIPAKFCEEWQQLESAYDTIGNHDRIEYKPASDASQIIPVRLYKGPISRAAVFEKSGGRFESNLEKLAGDTSFIELSTLAEAEMLIDGVRSVHEIRSRLHTWGIDLSETLFLDTLLQLETWGLIEFIRA